MSGNYGLSTIDAMRNSQGTTLLFLAVAVVLFFFSLTLLPAVELYCRFQRPAILLLVLQFVLLAIRIRVPRTLTDRALWIATFVFTTLGVAFNVVLLVTVRGKC
ncbi:MAG TPA: hypothetical protein VNX88_10515 [Terriglobales bacterium]|jgi:hypothetical protein|nr:hypothetical protein [Terriglobales bacterium]